MHAKAIDRLQCIFLNDLAYGWINLPITSGLKHLAPEILTGQLKILLSL